MKITPVILCGGSGTRLWPLSRNAYPKQLLPLFGTHTMLQETVLRLSHIPHVTAPLVVCSEEHRFMVAEQLQLIGAEHARIILEPIGKNTAPAIAIAALQLAPDDLMLVLPADHVIKNLQSFARTVADAVVVAMKNLLVTFGVCPTKPETGYGYIEKGLLIAETLGYQVKKFVEKPSLLLAEEYVQSNNYLWNSGMFMFTAGNFLRELERHAPEILRTCRKVSMTMKKDFDFMRINREIFNACPNESVDYAVMEKTNLAAVIPLDAEWSDVGSWSAVWEAKNADTAGNVLHGDVHIKQVENSYLHAESRLLAAVGVKDHIIVETSDAVLVAHKDYSQEVKYIVAALKHQQRSETETHRRVYRPWGYYEVLEQAAGYQVKCITIKPGAQLSLQMHHHRAEHWVVTKGVATVMRGERNFELLENESTYIPIGMKHRLQNLSTTPLVIIEVQTGKYLGEDDIVRFEDTYGRVTE